MLNYYYYEYEYSVIVIILIIRVVIIEKSCSWSATHKLLRGLKLSFINSSFGNIAIISYLVCSIKYKSKKTMRVNKEYVIDFLNEIISNNEAGSAISFDLLSMLIADKWREESRRDPAKQASIDDHLYKFDVDHHLFTLIRSGYITELDVLSDKFILCLPANNKQIPY